MAQITINVPDAVMPRVVNAFASTYGYQSKLKDGTANPETKAQFALRRVREYVKAVVVAAESRAAAATAAATATTTADTDIALT